MLPGLDPTTMGWNARSWYLGAHGGEVFDRNGNGGPTLWVDGEIVGSWVQRKDGTIAHVLLQDVSTAARRSLDRQLDRGAASCSATPATPSASPPPSNAACSDLTAVGVKPIVATGSHPPIRWARDRRR